MKTQITCYYDESPLKANRLMIGCDYWLEPGEYAIISNDQQEGTLVIEADIPERPCRFLGHSDGSPPACYGFGNPAAHGQPNHMERVPDGFAPELVCLHCQIYTGEREERRHNRYQRLDDHDILEMLPELDASELGRFAEHINYIDRRTGEIIG